MPNLNGKYWIVFTHAPVELDFIKTKCPVFHTPLDAHKGLDHYRQEFAVEGQVFGQFGMEPDPRKTTTMDTYPGGEDQRAMDEEECGDDTGCTKEELDEPGHVTQEQVEAIEF